MNLLETIDLAINQTDEVNPTLKQNLKFNLNDIRKQIVNKEILNLKEEEFYFESFQIQTESVKLNESLNTILRLLCLYLYHSQIDNTMQK
jgi:hypothetical protein